MLEKHKKIKNKKRNWETVSDKKLFHDDGKEGEEREMKGGASNPYLMTLLIVFLLCVRSWVSFIFLGLNWVHSWRSGLQNWVFYQRKFNLALKPN